MSGAQYSFNTHRLIFNRVTDAQLEEPAYAVNFGSQSLSKFCLLYTSRCV